jgi:hypothetical protein
MVIENATGDTCRIFNPFFVSAWSLSNHPCNGDSSCYGDDDGGDGDNRGVLPLRAAHHGSDDNSYCGGDGGGAHVR